METKSKEINFENFKWIDICNPEKTNLDIIAKEYNLDYFQIKDSLEPGHLPKFEKQEKYDFLILRAYTANFDQRTTNITDLSNSTLALWKIFQYQLFFADAGLSERLTNHRQN